MKQFLTKALAIGIVVIGATIGAVLDIYVVPHLDSSAKGVQTVQAQEALEPTHDLYKTVAHVDLSDVPYLELVYVDSDNDVAYYRYIGERSLINIGDEVLTVYNDTCTVTSTDCQGFTIDCPTGIDAGMSGTAIRDLDGTQIGFISKRLSDGTVRCIYAQ